MNRISWLCLSLLVIVKTGPNIRQTIDSSCSMQKRLRRGHCDCRAGVSEGMGLAARLGAAPDFSRLCWGAPNPLQYPNPLPLETRSLSELMCYHHIDSGKIVGCYLLSELSFKQMPLISKLTFLWSHTV